MITRKETGGFGWIMFAFVASAIAVLPGIAGYLYLSHRPLTRDQLIDVTAHVERWKVDRHQASGKAGGAPSNAADLTIYTSEHRAPFYVSDSFYEDANYFNAAAFGHDVKKGDALVFTIRKVDADLSGEGRIALSGLASQKAVYLNVENAMAFDALQRQTSLFLFIGSLVLVALLLAVARMLWKDRKKNK